MEIGPRLVSWTKKRYEIEPMFCSDSIKNVKPELKFDLHNRRYNHTNIKTQLILSRDSSEGFQNLTLEICDLEKLLIKVYRDIWKFQFLTIVVFEKNL